MELHCGFWVLRNFGGNFGGHERVRSHESLLQACCEVAEVGSSSGAEPAHSLP